MQKHKQDAQEASMEEDGTFIEFTSTERRVDEAHHRVNQPVRQRPAALAGYLEQRWQHEAVRHELEPRESKSWNALWPNCIEDRRERSQNLRVESCSFGCGSDDLRSHRLVRARRHQQGLQVQVSQQVGEEAHVWPLVKADGAVRHNLRLVWRGARTLLVGIAQKRAGENCEKALQQRHLSRDALGNLHARRKQQEVQSQFTRASPHDAGGRTFTSRTTSFDRASTPVKRRRVRGVGRAPAVAPAAGP